MSKLINSETLLKLRQRMIKHATFCRHPNPEDVAQDYVCRLLEGLHQHATVSQAYIDIIRLEANGRCKHYHAQLNLRKGVPDNDLTLSLLECSPEALTQDEMIDLKALVQRVKPRLQEMFNMRLNGSTLKEIATEYKVTESRISQIMAKEIKRLADSI